MVLLIGIAQVQLQNLLFHHSRGKIPSAVERLIGIFLENCDPAAVQNQIPVYVRPGELQQILEQSQLAMGDIQTGLPPYPRLDTRSKIHALHGRQRYEAALQCFGPEAWWVIRIYCLANDSVPETLLHDEINEYSQQTPFSDGEVLRQVCFYQQAGDWKRVKRWCARLSANKQRCLSKLLKSRAICERMFGLVQYPGLCGGLELGNIHKVLAEHCDEEICYHLDHIKDIWNMITLQKPEVREATDAATVLALERLAPACGYADQQNVRSLMSSGVIFSNISNPDVRREIEQQLLNVGVIIPSIKTFHENMAYLKIGLRILREHLLGRPHMAAGETVEQLMRSIWRPKTTLIEYGEDQFYRASMAPNFEAAYHIIFVSALRNFPRLSMDRPKTEPGHEQFNARIDEQYLRRFLRQAQALGFKSDAIGRGLRRQLRHDMVQSAAGLDYTSDITEPNLKRRTGCPSTRAYNVISRRLFLPEMLKEAEPNSYPSIIFIQTDFMRSFFRGFPHHLSVIARDPNAEAVPSGRSTRVMDNPPVGSSSPPNTPPVIPNLSQRSTSLALETRPNSSDVPLPSPVFSAAMSARDRRLHSEESGSLRSTLWPALGTRQDGGNSPSMYIAPDEERASTHQTPHGRETVSSIYSQDTQRSNSTGRTILVPHGLHSPDH